MDNLRIVRFDLKKTRHGKFLCKNQKKMNKNLLCHYFNIFDDLIICCMLLAIKCWLCMRQNWKSNYDYVNGKKIRAKLWVESWNHFLSNYFRKIRLNRLKQNQHLKFSNSILLCKWINRSALAFSRFYSMNGVFQTTSLKSLKINKSDR